MHTAGVKVEREPVPPGLLPPDVGLLAKMLGETGTSHTSSAVWQSAKVFMLFYQYLLFLLRILTEYEVSKILQTRISQI